MGNDTELVCRKIRTAKAKGKEVERYFDGARCLGGIDKIAKLAQVYYNLTTGDLAAACGCERKQVRTWITGKGNPNRTSAEKILRAIALSKLFRLDLSKISLTNEEKQDTLSTIPLSAVITRPQSGD